MSPKLCFEIVDEGSRASGMCVPRPEPGDESKIPDTPERLRPAVVAASQRKVSELLKASLVLIP